MKNLTLIVLIAVALMVSLSAISQSTITIDQEKDAHVRDGSYSTTNYGTDSELVVKNGSANFTRQSYLSFGLSGVPGGANITSAKLRLKISHRNSGSVTHYVQSVSDDSWGENSITWDNKPLLGNVLTQQSVGALDTWMEYDITQEAINRFSSNDFSFSIAITTTDGTNVRYYSDENGTSANDPELVVEYSRTGPMTFYVDALGGSDANAGTGTSTAWKSLDRVNSSTFIPGDIILFKAGGVWNGQLALKGSGNSSNQITIDQYSTGNKPIINGLGALTNSAATVLLKNIEYWEIRNLELTNTNGATDYQGDLWGILGIKDDGGAAHHIHIHDCYIHDVNGDVGTKTTGGIYITAVGSNPSWYDDLKIANNLVENVGGIGIATQSPHADIDVSPRYPYLNVYVKGNIIKNTGRNNMIIRVSDDPLVEHNRFINSSRFDTGNSVFCFKTKNMTMQYNEAYGNTGSGDKERGAYDADYNCTNTTIQYNYSHDNFWAFSIMRKEVNENVVIRYNISENEKKAIYRYGFDGSTGMTRAYVYNNTHFTRSDIQLTIFGSGAFEREAFRTDFNNNIFYFEGTGSDWGVFNSNVNFESNSFYNIAPQGTNFITSTPQLVNPGNGGQDIDWSNYPDVLTGYQLQSNSPCIDAGKTIANNGGQDFWGNTLYSGAADIGAFEYSGGGTLNLVSNGDAYVRGGTYSNINYGADTELAVKLGSANFTRQSFLKFDVSATSGTITSAKLKLVPSNTGASPEGTDIQVRFVSGDSWSENGITWNNKPTLGSLLDSQPGSGSTTEWDVTNQAETERTGDGVLSLGLESNVSGGQNFVDYYSKESASGQQPVLVVTSSSSAFYRARLITSNDLTRNQVFAPIYPNPVSDRLTIRGLEKPVNIKVVGIDGKPIPVYPEMSIDGIQVSVDHLTEGLYIIHYQDILGEQKSSKFIKK